jgi:DNA polymerase IV
MILHVDMDAFYASIEERDDSRLVGRPVIVGGTPQQRGVVAAANYEVRRFGVHSAMPTATAMRLCPQAIVPPVRMQHYADVSSELRAILQRYTPLVEPCPRAAVLRLTIGQSASARAGQPRINTRP